MKINKEEFNNFKEFCRTYFKNKRECSSNQIEGSLKISNPMLYKCIEKAVGKGKAKTYIGCSLLRAVKKEGWLTYENKVWKAKESWGYCTYCLKALDDVYLIDINYNQYCDEDCFDDHEAVHYYDSYVDDYLYLFWDFQSLKERYLYYLNNPLKTNFNSHLDLIVIQQEIFEVLNSDCFSTVLFNGGDDGPLAVEMYRMLMVLEKEAKILGILIEKCKNALPTTNQLFSIEIDEELIRKRVRPEILREFIRNHRKYRNQIQQNMWTTMNSRQGIIW